VPALVKKMAAGLICSARPLVFARAAERTRGLPGAAVAVFWQISLELEVAVV
jgi:hypothetical protein